MHAVDSLAPIGLAVLAVVLLILCVFAPMISALRRRT